MAMQKFLSVLIFLSGAFFLAFGASATGVLRAEFTQTKTLAGFERALTHPELSLSTAI